MSYINSISSISIQDSFNKTGFSSSLRSVNTDGVELFTPNYKNYIEAKLIRRMSNILRMSVACSQNCLEQVNIAPDAIIVGTGLGCLTDTKKFLENFILIEGMLPPTSFIQSTHNTIAGQVSLAMKNHGYNMTHTQNSLSFEMALEDGLICLEEDDSNVLIGAADEHIVFLNEFFTQAKIKLSYPMTSGVTFFGMSHEQSKDSKAKVRACKTFFNFDDLESAKQQFLSDNDLKEDAIDLVLYSSPITSNNEFLINCKSINICETAGLYSTNAALGFHIAVDKIYSGEATMVLIINNLIAENLGLTLIESLS